MKKTLMTLGLAIFSIAAINAQTAAPSVPTTPTQKTQLSETNLNTEKESSEKVEKSETAPAKETRILVKKEELPAQVKKGIDASEYKGWEIAEAYKTKADGSSEEIYSIRLKKMNKTAQLNLNSSGKIVEVKK